MKKKNIVKVLSSATLCAVMLAGVVLPFSACNLKYGEGEKNQVSALKLNPESDPIIYESNGIAIRSHQLSVGFADSIAYINLGTYNNQPINWLILAAGQLGSGDTQTEIGQAIDAEIGNSDVLWTPDEKLGTNQFLVISERVFSFDNYTVGELTRRTDTINLSCDDYNEKGKESSWVDRYELGVKNTLTKESDFFTSPSLTHTTTDFFDTVNGFLSNNFDLTEYLGNAIVKNSNFNPNHYGFMFTSALLEKYVPTSAVKAYDFVDTYQAKDYWCADEIKFAMSGSFRLSVSEEDSAGSPVTHSYYNKPTGAKKGYYSGKYISINGSINSIPYNVLADLSSDDGEQPHRLYIEESEKTTYEDGSTSRTDKYIYYATNGKITFSSTGSPTTTAYYRPAMVIDVSQLD